MNKEEELAQALEWEQLDEIQDTYKAMLKEVKRNAIAAFYTASSDKVRLAALKSWDLACAAEWKEATSMRRAAQLKKRTRQVREQDCKPAPIFKNGENNESRLQLQPMRRMHD